MDIIVWTLSALIVILIIAIIYTIYGIVKSRKERPNHVEMYFDANFRSIVDEWDLVTRPRLKDWKSTMSKRLDSVGKDISGIEKNRKKIDKRLSSLEKEVGKLESI